MPSSAFYAYFCARFALLKTGHSNRNLTKKSLKIESFLQKTQKFFCVFFLRPRLKSQILAPHPCLSSFANFSLNTLNSEEKPFVKKSVDRAGQPAMILKFTDRVEKILTGSISAANLRRTYGDGYFFC